MAYFQLGGTPWKQNFSDQIKLKQKSSNYNLSKSKIDAGDHFPVIVQLIAITYNQLDLYLW